MGAKKKKNGARQKSIVVSGLRKKFLVPHQKIDSVRGAFINLFSKNTYEEFFALDNVSFEVYEGEFVGILGHNGSGKSTLLKCLANVYTPDSGDVKIRGEISPFLELGIGFNPELSGRDNIYLNATILGLSQDEVTAKFDSIVSFSEVGEFIDQQVKNYSSGMKGRLAFSVSIHANRDILLMDEVLAVGDSRFQQKCIDHFKQYKKEKKTVVLVTHNMSAVREHCDRAILLHKGKIEMFGDPDRVADRYADLNMTKAERQLKLAAKKTELQKRDHARKEKKRQQMHHLMLERERRERLEREQIQKEHRERLEREQIQKELSKTTSQRHGSNITFLDLKVQNDTEDSLVVTIIFDVKKMPHRSMAVGVQLYEENTNCFIFGTNTHIDDFSQTWVQGENRAIIAISDRDFHIGNLRVDATIFLADSKKNDEWEVVARASEDIGDYEILTLDPGEHKGGGIVRVNHEWII